MTTTATAPSTEGVADGAEDPRAATPDAGSAAGRRRGPFPRGLVAAPFVLATLAVLLRFYVVGYDKDFIETSALGWESNLLPQIRQHLALTGWSTLWVLLIAIPLGVVLTRPSFRKVSGAFLTVANSGQALPAYGLFVVLFMWQGRGTRTAILALVIFTVLPVLRNTMVGLDQVSADVIESARGMGMTRLKILQRIELPLAVPVILAGVRTALVINVGMAALATFIGGGGLGDTINSGLSNNRELVTLTGAGLTALVALTVDWLAAVAERILRPRGL
ncbi:ABC transporter permease [soil metagenome]